MHRISRVLSRDDLLRKAWIAQFLFVSEWVRHCQAAHDAHVLLQNLLSQEEEDDPSIIRDEVVITPLGDGSCAEALAPEVGCLCDLLWGEAESQGGDSDEEGCIWALPAPLNKTKGKIRFAPDVVFVDRQRGTENEVRKVEFTAIRAEMSIQSRLRAIGRARRQRCLVLRDLFDNPDEVLSEAHPPIVLRHEGGALILDQRCAWASPVFEMRSWFIQHVVPEIKKGSGKSIPEGDGVIELAPDGGAKKLVKAASPAGNVQMKACPRGPRMVFACACRMLTPCRF